MLAYSLLVMAYTIIRSSVTICDIVPAGERNSILFVNSFSVAYSVVVFSLLMAVISSLAGACVAVILKKMLLYFNPLFNSNKGVYISGILSLILPGMLSILFYIFLGGSFTYPQTFLFWFLFPGIIFFAACMVAGIKLNAALRAGLLNHLVNQ